MKMNVKIKVKQKPLIIVELLFLYFAVLAAVSYYFGPVRYEFDTNRNLLSETEMSFFSDSSEQSEIFREQVLVRNPNHEGGFGVSAPISLNDAQCIQVRLTFNSTKPYEGKEIHLDLMGENYDSDEQESICRLVPGKQSFTCQWETGGNAPKDVLFRIFCLDPVELEAADISIYCGVPLPKIGIGNWIAIAIAGMLLITTLLFSFAQKHSTKMREKQNEHNN